ncbi:MAG: DNA replication/repair protein RecF [Lachnospiraceae bacterium]|nr:DNA replication/repair protein RecF [Lachnospiraceae bacterium]
MIIRKLQFEGFRNLEDGYIIPNSEVNVIYGTNAQGKTNLLEGIWLLSGNRSFRGARDSEFIKFGREFARLRLEFFSENREQNAEITFLKGKKDIKINGVKQSSANSLVGKFCAVVFSPEHLSLVKSGPSERRRFIDNAICQIKLSYNELLSSYNKTLAQRNALLKDIPYHSQLLDTLEIWDLRLASLGASIIKMRVKYIAMLNESAASYHCGISDNMEDLHITYSSSVECGSFDDTEALREAFISKLNESRSDDIKDGCTNFGPHRDDISIFINKINVKSFGSQGQQRSCVLSMKIAEAELLHRATDEEPIVLLDDVLSELDGRRQEFLLNKITQRQVFISCCEKASVERLHEGKLFEVKSGVVATEP